MLEKIEEKADEIEEKIEKQSFAMELLQYSKEQNKQLERANKRLVIIWIITFFALIGLSIYTIYLLNDISSVETTSQEVEQESDSGNNNFIGGNGDINYDKTKDKTNNN